MYPPIEYSRPTTLSAAIEELRRHPARLHAGGSDLLGCLRDGVIRTKRVLSLSAIRKLNGIERMPDGGLRIGAMTRIARVAASELVAGFAPGLAAAAASVASPQLRNQGTLGGNLCQKPRCWFYRGGFDCLRRGGDSCSAQGGDNRRHAIFGGAHCVMVHPSDTAPALVSLGAMARIVGPDGARVVPLEAFHMAPADDVTRETVLAEDEILAELFLPPRLPGLHSSYRKVRSRQSWDFALASLALALQVSAGRVTHARVVFGGVAPIPWRSRKAEDALLGEALNTDTIAKVAHAAADGAEALSGNAYKVSLVRGLIEEELQQVRG